MSNIAVVGDAMIDVYGPKIYPGGAALTAKLCDGVLYSFITSNFKTSFPFIKTNGFYVNSMTTKVYENGKKKDYDVICSHPWLFNIKEDIVIYSDYNKGCLHNAKLNKNKINIIDPKDEPLDRWIGCNILKLNEKEAYALTKVDENLIVMAKRLQKRLKCEMVIITLGAKGIVGHWKKGFKHDTREIVLANSIGAGDAFAASLALNYQEDLEELAIIAMKSATDYCEKPRC